ncbi:MAG: hypothetical protein UW96_C0003G0001, partial [Candidatus Collierbacteria bacterium GW2011_GWA1_45_15]
AFNEKKGRLEPENSLITRDNTTLSKNDSDMERVKGIGPSSSPWEGDILPVNYTRDVVILIYSWNYLYRFPITCKARPCRWHLQVAMTK